MMNYELLRTCRQGNGVGGRIFHTVTVDKAPSHRDLAYIQNRLGYDIMGYGDPTLLNITQHNDVFEVLFSHSASCD